MYTTKNTLTLFFLNIVRESQSELKADGNPLADRHAA
jgi:hypothetical protein